MMNIVLLLVLLTASRGVGRTVVGRTGADVTLNCTYDIGRHGPLSACWGRGQIPTSGCGVRLASTDGRRVTEQSGRFQLRGRLEDGDVSLTVLNVSQTDAGRYGCRVQISGWFNDRKHHVDLRVDTAPETSSSSALTTETSPETKSPTTDQTTSTERLLTSSLSGVTAEESGGVSVVLLCVLLGLLALVAAGAVVFIANRRRRLLKVSHPPPSLLQLQSRAAAEENIYQIQEDED